MSRTIRRTELIDQLFPALQNANKEATEGDSSTLDAFCRAVLRRVGDKYLYRHQMTTLGAQLRESFRWVSEHAATRDVVVRAFLPTEEHHGYTRDGVVFETLMPDQPFIVDTLKLFTEQAGLVVHNRLNVILPILLEDGRLVGIDRGHENTQLVSYTRWYITLPEGETPESFRDKVAQRLFLSQAMSGGFFRMVRTVKDIGNEFEYLSRAQPHRGDDCLEVRDFLAWLVEDHYIFMGITRYDRDEQSDVLQRMSTIGFMAEPQADIINAEEISSTDGKLGWPVIVVKKSRAESPVHRAGKVDEIHVPLFDDSGVLNGCVIIHGLFTFKGLNQPCSGIPILRRKLEAVLDAEEVIVGGFVYKGNLSAFNALPVEYVFNADLAAIRELLSMIVTADTTRQVQSEIVLDADGRSAYAFIAMPRKHFSEGLCDQMACVLKEDIQASYSDHRVYMGKFGTVALHFYFTGAHAFDQDSLNRLRNKLVGLATPWSYRLRDGLEESQDPTNASRLFKTFEGSFPDSYEELIPPEDAIIDVVELDAMLTQGQMRFTLVPSGFNDAQVYLRIYSREAVQLTALLPVVHDLGVVVVDQATFELTLHDGRQAVVSSLRIERGEHDALAQGETLVEALNAVFSGLVRSDLFNRLLLAASLTWKEVDLIRAYFYFARQTGQTFAPEAVQKVLLFHNDFAALLIELFRLRFEPEDSRSADTRARAWQAKLADAEQYLNGVKAFDEDRVLRLFLNLIVSTLRTNFYVQRSDDQHFISLKFDCASIKELPNPRPMFEIYVHHAEVEGIHLRGGKVARGGIRWSDRLEDYRTEVLGLMATQMLKNTVIVPVGAKGGFVIKDPIEEWAEGRARADRLYQIFIRGLLEVTDNIVAGEVKRPDDVLCHDDEDPYLVVAADKGTAHLSDTANQLASDAGFWLGDAFASGGSVGYDHKIKGITAKGAWVCVRHHFRELGMDPERDPITVVGVGDMSGDVFGNGMLLSDSMKLVAAFNHKHIFIDPNPDPASSFAERKRLFDLGRSTWRDYDTALLSTGGGIFDRGAKSIELSQEIQDAMGLAESTLSGEQLIQVVLKADVDLLWNGGIGTYIKASTETHQDVGDASNDRVRVDAEDLRCRVIGEGGNLGITMRGRVAFAQSGGLINLDAIDNSGGVDLSDHEVNIKILLSPTVEAQQLKPEDREKLLADVGDWVCDEVLKNNASQALAISLDEQRSQSDIWDVVLAMDFLKQRLGFSRREQRLPRDPRILNGRVDQGLGFLRPELAKLLSFSKMFAFHHLNQHPVGSKTELNTWLTGYFPEAVINCDNDALANHLLFNELAATLQVNHVIDMAGVTFLPSMVSATERGVRDIITAYLLAEKLLDAPSHRAAIIACRSEMDAQTEYQFLLKLQRALAHMVEWILAVHPAPLDLALSPTLESSQRLVGKLSKRWNSMLPSTLKREVKQQHQALRALGAPDGLAEFLALTPILPHVVPIAHLAEQLDEKPTAIATVYFGVGETTRVFRLISAVLDQGAKVTWDQIAISSIISDLRGSVLRFTSKLWLAEGGLSTKKTEGVLMKVEGMPELIESLEELLPRQIPVSALLVLSQRLKRRADAYERLS